MANERLTEIRTTMYQDASTTTLQKFIDHAIMDFEARVVILYNIYITCNESNKVIEKYKNCKDIKEVLYTTRFYEMFKNAGSWLNVKQLSSYHFKVNPKNINFEMMITDVKEELEHSLRPYEDEQQNPKDSIRFIKDIPEWQSLFGKGEFPFMTIYVFRLGNTEYFAYEIHR